MLKEKKILLGVTGGIAAYKIPLVVRLLKKAGAHVRVMMTESATHFITPLTLSTLSEEDVTISLWSDNKNTSVKLGVQHIDLSLWADAMLIAPATANTIAHLAHGYAEDAIGTTVLALRCPLLIAPAMDVDMYENAVTQTNITSLRARGAFILPPERGELASGLVGVGRMPEPETIVQFIESVLEKTPLDLVGKKILVTAGPTHEPIDPVRFIGNRSSGKMGFALANAAALRGADVTLISGPVTLSTPRNVKRIDVETAEEMYNAVLNHAEGNDAIIMSAAVADYTPLKPSSTKIKKSGDALRSLELKQTHDILKELGAKKNNTVLVGFALETNNEVANAQEKLRAKNLDIIILNSARAEGAGFGVDTNIVTIINANGKSETLPLLHKFDVATEILNRITKLFT